MTPQQKAAYIILKYMAIVIKQDKAKECALVAANEIIDTLDEPSVAADYWYQVKQEIESL